MLIMIRQAESTRHRKKYYCTADLLIDWFGFEQTSKAVVNSTKANHQNPNKINRRSVILPSSDSAFDVPVICSILWVDPIDI